MTNKIIFLGKFDQNMLSIEEKVINMNSDEKSDHSSYIQLQKDLSNMPDVKKYSDTDCNYLVILGDVNPNPAFKSVIIKTRIILLIFNLTKPETLEFVREGWGPIIKKVSKPEIQKRILIGTESKPEFYSEPILQQIFNTMTKLECDAYYAENTNNRTTTTTITTIKSKFKNYHFLTNLIEYIKTEISNKPIRSQPSQNKEINKKTKPNKKEETSKKKSKWKKIAKRKTYINKNLLSDKDDDVNKEEEQEEDKNEELDVKDELTKEEEEKEQKQENEEFKTIRKSDGFVYHYMMKTQTAELFNAETAQYEVEIPNFLHIDDFKYIITKICDYAFENSRITTLTFPKDSQIREIGNFAFKNSRIREIFIPASLERLEKYWCRGATNLSEIEVDSNNQHFYIEKDFLIHNIEPVPEILFVYRYSYIGTLNASMNIGNYAFYQYTGIQSLVSETDLQVLKIGDFSFFGSNLTNIKFKNEEIHLGDHCFSESTKLQSVEIIATRKLNFGSNSFSNCSSLTTISLLSESKENLIIPSDTFQNCKSIKELKIQTKSTLIINNETFSTIGSLEKVELISNKIKLCEKCFYNSFNSKNSNYNRQPNHIIISSESEIEIENNCFEESNLEKVEMNGRQIILKKEIFKNCSSLTTISLGSESKEDLIIPFDTFQNCKSLKELKIQTKSTLIINNETFSSIRSFKNVELISNKIKLCEKCFYNSFNSKNSNYNRQPNHIKISSESEIEIENNCFEESNLDQVEIKGRRVILKKEIFNNCSSLQSITISQSSEIIIDELTFNNCSKLNTFTLDQVGYIEFKSQVFAGCNQLKFISISKLPEYNSLNYFEIKTHPQQIKTGESFTILNKTTKEKYQAKILNDRLKYQELILIKSIILILKENKPTISSNFGICFLSYCEKQYLTILTNYYDEIKDEHINREEEEEEEDKNEEEPKQENEQFRTIKDSNCFAYNLIMKTKTAELFKAGKAQYEVKIPNILCIDKVEYKITKICDYAFENSAITTLTFQKDSQIRQIGNFAFKNSRIRKIFIPSSLERLDKYWCGGATNLSEIKVDRNNQHFYIEKHFLIHNIEPVPEILFVSRYSYIGTLNASMNIGSFAFYQYTKIQSLVSETDLQVLEIGDFSFFGSNLTNIKFKNEEIHLGDHCFSESTKLQSVDITATRKLNFGSNSFSNCSSLTTISLLNENEENLIIPSNTFQNCKSIKEIKIETKSTLIINNETFSTIGNLETVVLISNKIKLCEKCFYNSFNSDYNIYNRQPYIIKISSESEIEIENNCFEESNLVKVEIKGRRIILKKEIFKNCSSLQSITISQSSEIIIDELTFNNCINLNTFTLDQVGYIEFKSQVFSGCNQLKFILISKLPKYNSLDYFEIKTHPPKIKTDESFTIKNKKTKDKFQAKILNDRLKEHESISIDIEKIILISKENNPTISSNFGICFLSYYEKQYLTILTKYYENGSLDKSIQNKTLSNSQKYIVLIGLTLGLKYLETINIKQFNLTPELIFLDESFHPHLNEIIFSKSSKKPTFIPPEIKQRKPFTFKTYVYIYSLIIYGLITGIPISQIENEVINNIQSNIKQIKNIEIQQFIEKCMSPTPKARPTFNEISSEITKQQFIKLFEANEEEICIYLNLFGNTQLTAKAEKENISYIIFKPNKTAIIQRSEQTNSNINIPEYIKYQSEIFPITKISSKSFSKSSIKSISFSRNSNITHIGDYAFENSKLTEITIPRSVEIIGKNCFINSTIISIIILSTKIQIKENCFENCQSLKSIEFQNCENIIIGSDSFKGCDKLKQLIINSSRNITIESSCFSYLKSLQEVTISSEEIHIYKDCFRECSNLNSISFQASKIIKLYSFAFYSCQELSSIQIKSTNQIEIGSYCFSSLNKISYFTFESEEIKINNNCFKSCSNLSSIFFNKTKTIQIGSNVFENCDKLNKIRICSKSTITLSSKCFSNLKNLQEITLNSEEINIGESCFTNCTNLSSIFFDNAKTIKIGSNLFDKGNKLKKFYINSKSKIDLSNKCFDNLTNLQEITLNSEEINIGESCFNNCSDLFTISFYNVKNAKLGSYAFSGCIKLLNFEISATSRLEICQRCFKETKFLNTVKLRGGNLIIGDLIFFGCKYITSVSIQSYESHSVSRSAFYELKNSQIKQIYEGKEQKF